MTDKTIADVLSRQTELLETARSKGAQTLGGLALLVSQAAESLRLWTGQGFDVEEMAEAVASLR